jgi:hypothetical protein
MSELIFIFIMGIFGGLCAVYGDKIVDAMVKAFEHLRLKG